MAVSKIWVFAETDAEGKLTSATLEILTKAMPERYRLMVLLASWCALRFGELAELRRGDVDTKAGVIHVRRGVVRAAGETRAICGRGTPLSAGPSPSPLPAKSRPRAVASRRPLGARTRSKSAPPGGGSATVLA